MAKVRGPKKAAAAKRAVKRVSKPSKGTAAKKKTPPRRIGTRKARAVRAEKAPRRSAAAVGMSRAPTTVTAVSIAARKQRAETVMDASKVLFKWLPVWVAHSRGPRGLEVLGAMSLEEIDRLVRGWVETAEPGTEAGDKAAVAMSELLAMREHLNYLIDRLVDRELFGPAEPEAAFAV
jgi:hypothetical protein